MKKILATIIAMAMILSTVSIGVFASEEAELVLNSIGEITENEEIVEELNEAETMAGTELYVNCDYNSSTEGWGTTHFSNYSGAFSYASANAKNATIVIEKTNTVSGNCFDNGHVNYPGIGVIVNDGATVGNASSKWDVTYPVTIKGGGIFQTARPANASNGNSHIKNTLTIGENGAEKKATVKFVNSPSIPYKTASIAVLYNGKLVANNAYIEVGDLGFTGNATIDDSEIIVEGVVAFGKNNFYTQTMTNSLMTVKGHSLLNENKYYSSTGSILNKLTMTNSSITVDDGVDGTSAESVTFKTVTMNDSSVTVEESTPVCVGDDTGYSTSTTMLDDLSSLNVGELRVQKKGNLTVALGSKVTAKEINGTGKITIDAAGYTEGMACPIIGDASSFAGTFEVKNKPAGMDNLKAFVDKNGNVQLMNVVAEVDGVYYSNLQSAFDAADGKTVTLLGDVVIDENAPLKYNGDVDYSIGVKGNVTFDLNGYSVTGNAGSDAKPYALFCYQTKNSTFTVTDSSAAGTGMIYNNPVKTKSGKYTAAIYNNGSLVINGGTIKNAATKNGNRAYTIESVTVGTTSVVINGGNIISEDSVAMRVLSEGSAGSQVAEINGGTITGNVRVALKNGGTDTVDFTVTGGIINGDLSVENYGPKTDGAASDSVIIKGGELNGSFIVMDSVDTIDANVEISGGIFAEDIEKEYVKDSYAVVRTADARYTVAPADTSLTEKIFVKLVKTSDERIYNIVLEAATGYYMNRFSNADLKFVNNSPVVSYELLAREDGFVKINGVPGEKDRYEFHFNGTSAPSETGTEIVIGQVKFSGYGAVDFSVAVSGTNMAHTAEIADNIVATYIPGGSLATPKLGDLDISSAVVSGFEFEEATTEVKVVIEFNNNITAGNTALYNDMTVTLTGANGKVYTGKVGNDADTNEVNYEDGKDLVTFVFPKVVVGENGYYYTATVKGAGYRNATLTKRLTAELTEDEKTYLFWNNVKDVEGDSFLAGDIVKDNIINIYDLSAVVSYFGEENLQNTNPGYAKYDLNRDGKIDSKDVAYVLVSWNK